MEEDVEKDYVSGRLAKEFQKDLKIRLDKCKMDEVAKRISEKTDMSIEKAKSILQFGVADAILLNRFRSVFKDDDLEK